MLLLLRKKTRTCIIYNLIIFGYWKALQNRMVAIFGNFTLRKIQISIPDLQLYIIYSSKIMLSKASLLHIDKILYEIWSFDGIRVSMELSVIRPFINSSVVTMSWENLEDLNNTWKVHFPLVHKNNLWFGEQWQALERISSFPLIQTTSQWTS